jgi:hypothetical protein
MNKTVKSIKEKSKRLENTDISNLVIAAAFLAVFKLTKIKINNYYEKQ